MKPRYHLQALQSESIARRRRAALALIHSETEEVIQQLLHSLTYSHSQVNSWAAWILGQMTAPMVVSGLVEMLSHESSQVRIWAVWTLAQKLDLDAQKGLITALDDSNSEVRWRAVMGLGNIGTPEVVPKLLVALSDSDYRVAGQAAAALGKIGAECAVTDLKEMLFHSEFSVRIQAAKALGKISTEEAICYLIQALHHEDVNVRGTAVSALEEIRSEKAITGLIQALQDSDSGVRGKAVSALGKIGTEVAQEALNKTLQDSDASVRFLATQALQKLHLISDQNPLPNPISFTENYDYSCPSLLITDYATASQYILSSSSRQPIQHLISIGSPGIAPPHGYEQVPHRLRLEFDDIIHPDYDPSYVLATPKDLYKLLKFINSVNSWEGYLLVHCQAGISRSSAIALTIFASLLGDRKEREALAYVQKAQPYAKPNLWIVELADEILERRGKLVQAVEKTVRYSG